VAERVSIDQAKAIADDFFNTGYTCSQSSLQGLQAAFGLEDDNLWQAATGFGGGFGRKQLICGAISGGVIAAGAIIAAKRGSGRDDRAALRDESYALVRELHSRFEARFGSVDCRTLTGFDFSEPDGYKRFTESGQKERVCHEAVRFVIQTVAELVEER
jgi:C_GCAxxG_C_C family probable redox protein